MACHLFCTKRLSEPMMTYCQLDPKEHISMKYFSKFKIFHPRNAFENIICGMAALLSWPQCVNTLMLRQNGRHFADDTFNRIFVNENVRISIRFSLKFVPKGPINNIPALVQIMAWRRPGDKPLSEPMMVSLTMHICVTRPQIPPDKDYTQSTTKKPAVKPLI